MNNYEAIVIFYQDIEEEVRKTAVERLTDIINQDGSLDEVDEWGDRKFAYLIDDHATGFYYLLKFKATPNAVKEFDRVAKIQESIIRHMVINLDK